LPIWTRGLVHGISLQMNTLLFPDGTGHSVNRLL